MCVLYIYIRCIKYHVYIYIEYIQKKTCMYAM